MHRMGCTIMKFPWCSSSSCYQFLAYKGWFLIGTRLRTLEQAVGMKIRLWIALEWWFQFWVFGQNFKFHNGFWAQLFSLWALGLCFWLCSEGIRLTKLAKIFFIHSFQYLIFHHYVSYLFHVLFVQSCSNQTKSCHIGMCTRYWG